MGCLVEDVASAHFVVGRVIACRACARMARTRAVVLRVLVHGGVRA